MELKLSINCPSYKRADNVKTFDYLSDINVWVAYEEYGDYIKNYPDKNILQCDKGIQGNISRVRNYIIKKELKNNDVVCIIDDDFNGFYYYERKERIKVKGEDFKKFILKYSILAKELGVYHWGVNVNQDKQSYREYTPFSLKSYIGAPFGCFLKGNNCWYDERLPLKEDYDMTLQQINKNRKILRVNKFFYVVKQSEQKGGCATYRNYIREKEQFELLQKKWGSQIVKMDKSNNRSHNMKKKKNENRFDYNPIVRVPIKGV